MRNIFKIYNIFLNKKKICSTVNEKPFVIYQKVDFDKWFLFNISIYEIFLYFKSFSKQMIFLLSVLLIKMWKNRKSKTGKCNPQLVEIQWFLQFIVLIMRC